MVYKDIDGRYKSAFNWTKGYNDRHTPGDNLNYKRNQDKFIYGDNLYARPSTGSSPGSRGSIGSKIGKALVIIIGIIAVLYVIGVLSE